MNVPSSNAALVARPGWFAHRLDPERGLVHLVPATRADLRAATFLTDVNLPRSAAAVPAALEAAVAAASGRPPVHFLFHSAFCCSTLLARALDREAAALSLREPVILNDVAGWRGRGAAPTLVVEALDRSLRLLVQAAATGEAVLVKPSNLVNPLAPAMLALRPDARAILLYAPLPTFLASVASKQLEGRLWVRDLWAKLLRLGAEPFGFDEEELFRHTDIQVAALGWLAQHRLFSELTTRFPERVRTLSSAVLLAEPSSALAAAARHYRLPWSSGALLDVAAGPLFTRHAKTGEAFGKKARDELHRSARAAHQDELGKVEQWAMMVAEQAGVPLNPALPLLS